MSGKVDYISDGWTVVAIENGHELQGNITGSGCMCSASIACFLTAINGLEDAFTATVAAYVLQTLLASHSELTFMSRISSVLAYNIAAEIASQRPDVKGPNTFRAALIDECSKLDASLLQQHARVTIL